MALIPCFLVEPSGRALLELRRYVVGERCELAGIHSTTIAIGELDAEDVQPTRAAEPHELGDHRWPVACPCGRLYTASDAWLRQGTELWRSVDQPAARWPRHELPAGAMFRATWLERAWRGPDGQCLAVMTPSGLWVIDSNLSSNGAPWSRTGTPPRITATPSIELRRVMHGEAVLRERYHAELRDGVLVGLP